MNEVIIINLLELLLEEILVNEVNNHVLVKSKIME